MIAAGKGNILSANNWGKAKTISQIVGISAIIAVEYAKYIFVYSSSMMPDNLIMGLEVFAQALLWLSVAITIISGWIYLYDNRKIFMDSAV
jgi:CDP-diacylglycerol--glycerol-3-phosphate 3-phosphatidyltransferase